MLHRFCLSKQMSSGSSWSSLEADQMHSRSSYNAKRWIATKKRNAEDLLLEELQRKKNRITYESRQKATRSITPRVRTKMREREAERRRQTIMGSPTITPLMTVIAVPKVVCPKILSPLSFSPTPLSLSPPSYDLESSSNTKIEICLQLILIESINLVPAVLCCVKLSVYVLKHQLPL